MDRLTRIARLEAIGGRIPTGRWDISRLKIEILSVSGSQYYSAAVRLKQQHYSPGHGRGISHPNDIAGRKPNFPQMLHTVMTYMAD